MIENRNALREHDPEAYVGKFIRRYNRDKNNTLTREELTIPVAGMIGLPVPSMKWEKRAITKNP